MVLGFSGLWCVGFQESLTGLEPVHICLVGNLYSSVLETLSLLGRSGFLKLNCRWAAILHTFSNGPKYAYSTKYGLHNGNFSYGLGTTWVHRTLWVWGSGKDLSFRAGVCGNHLNLNPCSLRPPKHKLIGMAGDDCSYTNNPKGPCWYIVYT